MMIRSVGARSALAVLFACCLTACGGGGDGGSPQPPAPTYSIGGAVTGLAGAGLVLQNNGGANLSVSGDGPFTFTSQVASGGAYSVSVLTQPTAPSQTCVVANGAGSVSSANVANIAVTCTTNSYTVGATVSGLAGAGLVVINNGADDRAITADGAFTFATSVQSGAPYDVRVLTHPRDPVQRCTVANGTGAVGAGPVTSPAITCVTQHPRYAYALDYNDASISVYAVDAASGQLRPRGHARAGVRPVDGVGTASGRYVYILNRGSASVSAYSQDGTTGDLTEMAGSPYATGGPSDSGMRISLHPNSRFLYVANGPANTITAFRIDETSGALSPVSGSPFAAGSNPNHLAIDGRGAFAYVANRDSDDLYAYRIDASTGALVEAPGGRVSTGADSSPAVLTLHPSGRYAYVANTTAGSVSAFAIDATTGVLTPAPGSPYAAGANPAETVIHHPSGRFLYVRSVGPTDAPGALNAYSIDLATGALTAIGPAQALGVNSSYAWMHPTGRFLLVANRGTPLNSVLTPGSILVFSIDAATGALSIADTRSLTPSPYSVSADSSGRFVYVASATGNLHYAFDMDPTSGVLTPLANGYRTIARDQPISLIAYSSPTAPHAPVFRSRHAYVANMVANTISGYAIDADSGALTAAAPTVSAGAGPRAVAAHPRGRFALSINQLGGNQIASYAVTASTGALASAHSTLPTAGSAPVALAMNPNGRAVYLAHRLDAAPTPDMVGAYNVNATTGALSPITSGFNGITSFTPLKAAAVSPNGRYLYFLNDTHYGWARINDETGGYTGDNGNAALGAAGKAAFAIHPSGRFAYVAVSGAPGSAETYSINAHTGVFTLSGDAPVGDLPRGVAVDPTGRFVYVANSASHDVSMFAVNQESGALTAIAAPIAAGTSPIAIAADYRGWYVHVLSQGTSEVLSYRIDQATGALTLSGAPAPTGAGANGLALTHDVE